MSTQPRKCVFESGLPDFVSNFSLCLTLRQATVCDLYLKLAAKVLIVFEAWNLKNVLSNSNLLEHPSLSDVRRLISFWLKKVERQNYLRENLKFAMLMDFDLPDCWAKPARTAKSAGSERSESDSIIYYPPVHSRPPNRKCQEFEFNLR